MYLLWVSLIGICVVDVVLDGDAVGGNVGHLDPGGVGEHAEVLKQPSPEKRDKCRLNKILTLPIQTPLKKNYFDMSATLYPKLTQGQSRFSCCFVGRNRV